MLTALATAPAAARTLELLHKINLPRQDYRIAQPLYRGWALLGALEGGALFSTLPATMIAWKRQFAFLWHLVAPVCLGFTQLVFWLFTFPANQQTNNWSRLPAG